MAYVSTIEVYQGVSGLLDLVTNLGYNKRRLGSRKIAHPDGGTHTLYVGREGGHGLCGGPENGWCGWLYVDGLDRHVSRDQFRVRTSGKNQALIPTGHNSTYLNGKPLKNDIEYQIYPGQRITVKGSNALFILR